MGMGVQVNISDTAVHVYWSWTTDECMGDSGNQVSHYCGSSQIRGEG